MQLCVPYLASKYAKGCWFTEEAIKKGKPFMFRKVLISNSALIWCYSALNNRLVMPQS